MPLLEDLVLFASAFVFGLVIEILYAGIRTVRKAEIELENEVPELLDRADVAAAAKLRILWRKLHPLSVCYAAAR